MGSGVGDGGRGGSMQVCEWEAVWEVVVVF